MAEQKDKCPDCLGKGRIEYRSTEPPQFCITCNGTGEKKLDRPELERQIDLEALAGTHRVIPCFKEYCDGEPINAYLTSASITKILKNILALIPTCDCCERPLEVDAQKQKIVDAVEQEGERIIDLLQNLIELSEKNKEPSIKVRMMDILQALKEGE